MAIKTILLHMAPDENRQNRFAIALDLAKRHGAHLEIAYMTSPASMPAAITGRGASHSFIAESTRIAAEKADKILSEMTEACEGSGIAWNWEVLEGNHNELLAERSHYADLMIVNEHHGVTLEGYVGLHMPEEMLMDSTCPVLVLPKDRRIDTVGKRVMIAWKDTREAARAVRESLGVLKAAEHVFVLTCDRPHHRFEAGRDILAYLTRHGIDVEPVSDIADKGNVGPIILSYADDVKADLLVMGAYGHSRWREIVFGGVTHHILKNMHVPLLVAH
jgi:nucleotide-binding universal stress UspA family protein